MHFINKLIQNILYNKTPLRYCNQGNNVVKCIIIIASSWE